MKKFSSLLEKLLFTPSRNKKISALKEYIANTPDPDRGYALAAITGDFKVKNITASFYHQLIKDHVDVGDHNSARRFLVMFLYLNTVEVGGQTMFPRLGESISPQTGRVLMFPANWQYRHAGLPPESDNKYIVGTYLHYL